MGKELEGKGHKILDDGNFLVLKITVLEMIFLFIRPVFFGTGGKQFPILLTSHVYSRTLWP